MRDAYRRGSMTLCTLLATLPWAAAGSAQPVAEGAKSNDLLAVLIALVLTLAVVVVSFMSSRRNIGE